MLMKCPKCGFVQPEDQFCARCGVDVKNYQTLPSPLLQRVLSHPSVWVILFSVTTYFMFEYLRQERSREIEIRADFLKKGPQFVNQPITELDETTDSLSNPDSALVQASPSSTEETPNSSALTDATATTQNADTQAPSAPSPNESRLASSAAVSSETSSAAGASEESKKTQIIATLTYYEVETQALQELLQQAGTKSPYTVDFGDYRAGPLVKDPDTAKWTKYKSKKIIFNETQRGVRWLEGSRDPEIGFFLQLSVNELKLPTLAELEMIKLIPEEGQDDNPMPTTYPNTIIDIQPGQKKWFVAIKLPRNASKVALGLLKDPLFDIYRSDSFLNKQTEFTIVLQFDNN